MTSANDQINDFINTLGSVRRSLPSVATQERFFRETLTILQNLQQNVLSLASNEELPKEVQLRLKASADRTGSPSLHIVMVKTRVILQCMQPIFLYNQNMNVLIANSLVELFTELLKLEQCFEECRTLVNK